MKCPNCGADLLDDSIFCRDCGIKLPPPKRRCKYCGAELEEGAKCCTNCGQRIEPPVITRAVSEGTRQATTGDAVRQNVPGDTQVGNQSRPTQSNGKNTQFAQIWNKMDLFFKCIAIFGAVLFLVILGAAFAHKTAAMIIALLQICGLVVVVLMHKEYIVTQYSWLKYVIAAGCLLLSVLLILSFSWGTNAKKKSSSSVYQSATQPPEGRASSALVATAQPVKTTRPTKKPSSTSTPRPTAKPTPVPSPTDVPTAAPEDINFAIEVDFVQNLIFSQYNVDLYLDDNYMDTLIHGKYYVSLHKINAGRHTISFKEVGGSNSGSTYFTIEKDSTFVCHIKATSSGVEIFNNYIYETMDGVMATMPNTVGLLYSEALTELTQRGFGNISYKTIGNHIIWDNDNWLVLEQSVAVDTEIQKSESIELTCISLNDYFKNTYVGKNVNDIQQLANDAGFSIRFEISSGSSMDSDIKSMSKKTKAEWVATDARQYGGVARTAVVTISYTGTATPTPIIDDDGWILDTKSSTHQPSTATATPKTSKKSASASNHSSNNRDIAKKGDSGVFAYQGGNNYIYIIIDFEEGYVYRFIEGNGDNSCERVKIDSGDLNQGLQVTYHDSGMTWSNWFHFKWKNQPEILILLDNDYFDWTFYETDIETALLLKSTKRITDY